MSASPAPARPPDPEGARADRFLDAFSRIEKRLRVLAGQPRGDTFFAMARTAATRDPAVNRVFDDLRELADLRNAIVHDRVDGRPIADPHEATVLLIERIAEQLERPPRVSALRRQEVVTCAPGEPIAVAATRMLEGDFAQIPIYEGSRWRGLLTAETIARWLAHRFEAGQQGLEVETIEVVLGFRDSSSAELFVRAEEPIVDVIEAFHRHAEAGRTLDAVLVTPNGRPDERPLSILTVYDLPEMYRHVAVDRGDLPPKRTPVTATTPPRGSDGRKKRRSRGRSR